MLVTIVMLPSAIDVLSDWSCQDPSADRTRCVHIHHTLFLTVIIEGVACETTRLVPTVKVCTCVTSSKNSVLSDGNIIVDDDAIQYFKKTPLD